MSEGKFGFANAFIPQADHDFETFCVGGRKYVLRYIARLIWDRSIDLRICPDNGEVLGVWVELFQRCARWVRG